MRRRATVVLGSMLAFSCAGPLDTPVAVEAALSGYDPFVPTVAVGTLDGQIDVSNDGQLSYRATIEVPPGRAGMQPDLALAFSSGGGESSIGVGWQLSGLSAISRCPRTFAQDGVRMDPDLSSSDRLCLDGSRLVSRAGVYGANGTQYSTEFDSHRRIIGFQGGAPAAEGYSRFLVELPNGRDLTYGGTEDSRVAVHVDGQLVRISWLLSEVRDPDGNWMRFTYDRTAPPTAPDGVPTHALAQVSRIDYGGYSGDGGTLEASRSVQFHYADVGRRRDVFQYGSLTLGDASRRLESITTHVGTRTVREYLLSGDADNPAGQWRVTELRECAPGTGEDVKDEFRPGLVCKPPTVFEWTDPGAQDVGRPLDDVDGLPTFDNYNVDISSRRPRQTSRDCPDGLSKCWEFDMLLPLDMNGDGADDLLYFAESGPTMFAARLGGFSPRSGATIEGPIPFTTEIRPVIRDGAGAVLEAVPIRADSAHALDWNLDGLDDVLFWQYDGSISVLLSDGTDFTLVSTSLSLEPLSAQTPSGVAGTWDFRPVELNGDGRTDLVACQQVGQCTDTIPIERHGEYIGNACRGTWVFAMRSADGGFEPLQTTDIETICYFDFGRYDNVAPGDFDGDGLTELMIGPDPRVDETEFTDRLLRWNPSNGELEVLPTNIGGLLGQRAVDLNGDGLHDLVGNAWVRTEGRTLIETRYALATGIAGRFTEPAPYGPTDLGTGTRMRAEYLATDYDIENAELCLLSTADPILALVLAFEEAPCRTWIVYQTYNTLPLVPFEINGDGRGDVLVPTLPGSDSLPHGGQWSPGDVSVLQGAGWDAPRTFGTGFTFRGSVDEYVCGGPVTGCRHVTIGRPHQIAVDGDGDGALDLVEYYDEHHAWLAPDQPLVFFHNIRAQRAFVSAIVDGYGARTEVDYEPISTPTVYTPSTSCGTNQRCVTSSMRVVERIRTDTVVGAPRSTVYEYEDGRVDLQGRGWLGFARVRATDPSNGAFTETFFDNTTFDSTSASYPYAHRPVRVRSVQTASALSGAPASVRTVATETKFQLVVVHPTANTTRVDRTAQDVVRVESMGVPSDPISSGTPVSHVTTSWSDFDAHGQARSTTTQEALTGTWTTVSTEFANDEFRWVLGVPDYRREQSNGEKGVCQYDVEWDFTPDLAHGRVESVTRNPGDPATRRTTDLIYDEFGNLYSVVTSAAEADPRTLTIDYDGAFVFPRSIMNALGHKSELLYEPGFGIVQASQDPNGNARYRHFDVFGRIRKDEAVGFERTTIDYHRADWSTGDHDIEVSSTVGGRQRLRFDRLGRQKWVVETHARITTVRETRYDERGRIIAEGEPHDVATSETARTTFVYDGLDRLRRIVGSEAGENTEIWYEPSLTRRRDAAGYETEVVVDGRGQVSSVSEPSPGGKTEYDYCGTGALYRVTDALGNITYANYDTLGRRHSLDDPDTGLSKFYYNGFDEIRTTVDGANRETKYDIDQLGRIFGRYDVSDSAYTSWEWDTAYTPSGRPILGALHRSVSGDLVSDTNEYDERGRLTATVRQHGTTTLTAETTYDGEGRPETFSYPTTLGAAPFVVRYVRDPASQEIVEVRNGSTTLWRLDAQSVHGQASTEHLWGQTRWSTYTASGRVDTLKTSSGIQNLNYDYDSRGLLSIRRDGATAATDTFTHDGLGRIREVRRGGSVVEWYDYDVIGNLTDSHDGWRVYPGPGESRPHGAIEFQGSGAEGTVAYDLAGNATDIGKLHVEYNQLNLPRLASDGSATVTFDYDAAGSRARKTGTSETLYFGLYEREQTGMTIVERFQIVAPTGVIAQVERAPTASGGTATTQRLLFTDRQGTVNAVYQSGTGVQRIRYDSFGGVVSTTGAVTRNQPTADVSVGYTGHEHDPELGLLNMGGRIFHPIMRRFLTADPFSGGVGQGLNRYSYVRNSPYAFTDPSGFQEVPDVREPPEPPPVVYDYPDDFICVGPPGASCDNDAEPAEPDASDSAASERAGADVVGQSPPSPAPDSAGGASPPAPLPPGVTPPGGGLYEQNPIRLGVAVAMERLFNFPEADRGFVTPREQHAIRVGGLVGDGIGIVLDVGGVFGGLLVAGGSIGGGLAAEIPSLGSSTAVVVGGAIAGVGMAAAAAADGQSRIDRALDNVRAMAGRGGASGRLSVGQMQVAIQRGQAPRGIVRIDRPRYPGERLHVHLDDGSALNVDGTWRHLPERGTPSLTRQQAAWLEAGGWTLPR